jgi:hypothetical protein
MKLGLFIALLTAAAAHAETLTGRVVGISDGDSSRSWSIANR